VAHYYIGEFLCINLPDSGEDYCLFKNSIASPFVFELNRDWLTCSLAPMTEEIAGTTMALAHRVFSIPQLLTLQPWIEPSQLATTLPHATSWIGSVQLQNGEVKNSARSTPPRPPSLRPQGALDRHMHANPLFLQQQQRALVSSPFGGTSLSGQNRATQPGTVPGLGSCFC